jgi:beta-mannosidase
VELTGPWRAHLADDDLRRVFHLAGHDDHDWPTVTVPGHWRSEASFATGDGPLLYRTRFHHPTPAPERRTWLSLDGVFSQGDVWLDGSYIGDTEGYFFAHAFEITDQLAERTEHLLAVEVGCPPVRGSAEKRSLTGAFQDGDHLEPGWNPGGIWRPVRVVETGPVAIRHGRVICRDATEERTVLALRLVVDTVEARTVTIHTAVAGVDHEHAVSLATGENRIEWTVAVTGAERWWPHALGRQTLHDVRVEVRLDGGEVSDARSWRTGFRSVELRDWVCRINGERLYLKGVTLSPIRPDLGTASREEITAVLRSVRDAGLDLVRVHAHLARPELYEAADELGLLVWQDLPLVHHFSRSVRTQAQRQAREAVDLVGHHPSVAIWCAHDEPYAVRGPRRDAVNPGMLRQQLPSWNRSVLDRTLKRVLAKNDGSRPVIAHSGVAPHLPQLDGTDAHLWFGWYEGTPADLARFARTLPRHVRFVSAFGAQAPPEQAAFADPEHWPHLDWERLAAEHGLELDVLRRIVPPEHHPTFTSWCEAAQAHQADVVARTVEILRRLKYRPSGGFCAYRWQDVTPQIGFGLLDHTGRPKAAWHAFVDACRPVTVVTDLLPSTLLPGTTLELDVHVISDERVGRPGATVRARLDSPLGPRTWEWQGDIAADDCTRVGRLRWIVPSAPGPVTLDLELHGDDMVVTNRYVSRVTAVVHPHE